VISSSVYALLPARIERGFFLGITAAHSIDRPSFDARCTDLYNGVMKHRHGLSGINSRPASRLRILIAVFSNCTSILAHGFFTNNRQKRPEHQGTTVLLNPI
jgi:hypothetical protein